ncbi:MAG: hypothetical protein AAFO15_01415 [Pseudomonadota bacterium]
MITVNIMKDFQQGDIMEKINDFKYIEAIYHDILHNINSLICDSSQYVSNGLNWRRNRIQEILFNLEFLTHVVSSFQTDIDLDDIYNKCAQLSLNDIDLFAELAILSDSYILKKIVLCLFQGRANTIDVKVKFLNYLYKCSSLSSRQIEFCQKGCDKYIELLKDDNNIDEQNRLILNNDKVRFSCEKVKIVIDNMWRLKEGECDDLIDQHKIYLKVYYDNLYYIDIRQKLYKEILFDMNKLLTEYSLCFNQKKVNNFRNQILNIERMGDSLQGLLHLNSKEFHKIDALKSQVYLKSLQCGMVKIFCDLQENNNQSFVMKLFFDNSDDLMTKFSNYVDNICKVNNRYKINFKNKYLNENVEINNIFLNLLRY